MSNAQALLDMQTQRVIGEAKDEVNGFYKHTLLDLDAVCADHDIKLLEGEFEDENQSGALIRENGEWSIIVNRHHPLNRKRFTIAHELGHFFAVTKGSTQAEIYLEENGDVIKDFALMKRTEEVEEGSYQVERQANMIAASILMPDEMVLNLYNDGLSVAALAGEFGVSEIAMDYKLKRMGIDSLESSK